MRIVPGEERCGDGEALFLQTLCHGSDFGCCGGEAVQQQKPGTVARI